MSRRLGLVGTFALWSFVATAIFTVAVTLFAIAEVERLTVDAFAKAVSQTVNAGIINALDGADPSTLVGQGSPASARMERFVREGLLGKQIRAVKVWDRDARVVYSTLGEAGQRFPEYDPVKKALAGSTLWETEISNEEDPESSAEVKAMGEIAEVYAPLRLTPNGRVLGVFEVYVPYGPIRGAVPSQLARVWGLSILAGAVLYLVQLVIVKRASDRLKATQAQADELNARLEGSMRDLEEYSIGTLQALNAAVDAKDSYTARHSLGVADFAVAIGRQMGLESEQLMALERAALLHDIGKIGIPEAILLKPRQLTREEYKIVHEHSDMGARIIESIPFLKGLVPIVRHHHERWDGAGYPFGLSGENIPELARVLSVADAYEAMTSDRPYRRGFRPEVAREELLRNISRQFDAVVVEALLSALDAGEIRATSRQK